MIAVNTWLPVFPGFYGTIFEADTESEIDSINQDRRMNGDPKIKDCNVFKFDFKDYAERVSQQCTKVVENKLNELGFEMKLTYQKVYSPKEYNFANDSVDIEITFDESEWGKIQIYLNDHLVQYEKHLKAHYKSCDGFSSFYSYDVEEWNLPFEDLENTSHKVGSILQFILQNEGVDDMYLYYGCDDIFLSCDNYDELVSAFVCEDCGVIITESDQLEKYNEQLKNESAKMHNLGIENFSVKSFEQWKTENPIVCECEE